MYMSHKKPEKKLGLSQLKAWEGLVETHSRAMVQIERQMDKESPLPLHWYDILFVINRTSEKRLRLGDIADLIITSRSALTRSVDKLEVAGLIKKTKCKEDGRGQYAAITNKGHRLLKEAWGTYRQSINNYFGQYLNKEESLMLAQILSKVDKRRLSKDDN